MGVGGLGETLGTAIGPSGYVASVEPRTAADVGNTFSRARRINLDAQGNGSREGSIERSGDVDMFRFVAPVTGRMTITQSAHNSRLDSYLYVYDRSQRLLRATTTVVAVPSIRALRSTSGRVRPTT